MTTQAIGTREKRLPPAARTIPQSLSLAAAPTFAIMALVTGVHGGGPHDVLCAAAQHASPMNGMAGMYLLMSVFHSAPWLKLISRQRLFDRRNNSPSPDIGRTSCLTKK